MLCCKVGNYNIAKWLDKYTNLNYDRYFGDFFHTAFKNGHVELVEYLYIKFPSKIVNNFGHCIGQACQYDKIKLLSFFLENIPQNNSKIHIDHIDHIFIEYALKYSSLDTIKLFVDKCQHKHKLVGKKLIFFGCKKRSNESDDEYYDKIVYLFNNDILNFGNGNSTRTILESANLKLVIMNQMKYSPYISSDFARFCTYLENLYPTEIKIITNNNQIVYHKMVYVN